jgi:hypothetical protein
MKAMQALKEERDEAEAEAELTRLGLGVSPGRHAQQQTPRSSSRPRSASRGRSVDELSYGDAMRRKAHLEALRLQAEQRELEGATFQPQLFTSSLGDKVNGRLRILSDSDSYIDRLREERNLKQEKALVLARERERKELENCTFRPQIHDAPDYVKRIAKAVSLSRKQTPQTSRDWV